MSYEIEIPKTRKDSPILIKFLSCEGVRPFDLRIASSSLVRCSLKASISLTIISARLCIFGLGFDSIKAKNLPKVETSSFT